MLRSAYAYTSTSKQTHIRAHKHTHTITHTHYLNTLLDNVAGELVLREVEDLPADTGNLKIYSSVYISYFKN